ncbi:MAG: tetratricopeptide repeat protein [Candidatus Melainabacteria bacterium]
MKKKEGGYIHVQPHFDLGALAHSLSQYRKAVLHYRKEIKQSNSSKAHYNLGVIFQERRRYLRAISEYTQAIKGHRAFHQAYCNMGVCYRRLRRYEQAIKMFQKAVQLDQDNEMYQINLALAYADDGAFDEAGSLLREFFAKSKQRKQKRK